MRNFLERKRKGIWKETKKFMVVFKTVELLKQMLFQEIRKFCTQ